MKLEEVQEKQKNDQGINGQLYKDDEMLTYVLNSRLLEQRR